MKQSILFVFLLLLCANHCNAQVPVIVKDFNNCTVGLQDGSGNWIVQPVYEQIDPFKNGFARALRGGKWGLLNLKGKETVEAKYATLDFMCDQNTYNKFTRPGILKVSDQGLSGVTDTNGTVILPCIYKAISCRIDSVFVVKDQNTWSFIHPNGNVVHTDIQTEPTILSRHLYRFTKIGSLPATVGLITDKGEVAIPALYEKIDAAQSPHVGYEVFSKGKYGYYDAGFRMILDCAYDSWHIREYYGRSVYSYMLKYGMTGITRNGKTGVITLEGDTVIPIIYDSIRVPENGYNSNVRVPYWEVKQNGEWGILDSTGNWLVHPTLDKMWVEPAYNGYYTRGTVLPAYTMCVGRTNNKLGVLNLVGDTILPFVYDSCWTSNSGMVFWSPDDCVCINFYMVETNVGLTHRTMKQWYGSEKNMRDQVSREPFWEGYQPVNGDTLISYNPELWKRVSRYTEYENQIMDTARTMSYPYVFVCDAQPCLSIQHIERKRAKAEGFSTYIRHTQNYYLQNDNFIEVIYDSISGSMWRGPFIQNAQGELSFGNGQKGGGIFSYSGELIIPPGKYLDAHQLQMTGGRGIYSVETRKGKWGLLDSTGAIVIDTIWDYISEAGGSIVWLEKKNDFNNQLCPDHWSAYDLSAKTFIVDPSLGLLTPMNLDHKEAGVSTRTGYGILRTPSMEAIIPPIYSSILPLDDSAQYFAVRNCTGKFGVYDPEGNLIVDTLYSNIHITECRKVTINNKAELIQTYVFSNSPTDFVVLHLNDETMGSDTSQYRSVLKQYTTSSEVRSESNGYSYRARNLQMPLLTVTGGVDAMRMWQCKWLFTELTTASGKRSDYRSNFGTQTSSCVCRSSQYYFESFSSSERKPINYQVVYFSDSIMSSLSTVNGSNYSDDYAQWYDVRYTCINKMETATGPVDIDLFDLFRDSLWNNIVVDSVMSFLKAHPGIEANCSKPELYPYFLREDFLIMEDGIYFYPEWSKSTNGATLSYRPIIFVPWTPLRPHLTPEMQRKIFDK